MYEEVKDSNIKQIAKENGTPYSAIIEIITKCNFNCEHCYIPEHTEEMAYVKILNIVNQLYDIGVFEITLTGGEIVLHSSFMDIVRYIRKKGIRLILMSNVSMLSEKHIKEIAELHVNSISTTLFSLNERTNDLITGKKQSKDIVIQKVLLLKQYGVKVDIKVPIMKKNYEDYTDILDFCKKNGIEISYSVAITARTNGDRKPLEFGLCQEQLNHFMEENDKKSKNSYKRYENEEYLCSAVATNISIDVCGNVSPCNSFPYIYGNVFKNSLYDIWYILPERQRLKEIKKGDCKQCIECSLNQKCTRCPGLAYADRGNLYDCSEWDRMLAIARSI